MLGAVTQTIEMRVMAAVRNTSFQSDGPVHQFQQVHFKMDRNSDYIDEHPRHFFFFLFIVETPIGRLTREKHIDCLNLKQAGLA